MDDAAAIPAAHLPDSAAHAPHLARDAVPDVEVCIVGSGFSGLGMAIRLQRAGIASFTILEQAGEIGGTWRDNTYPGCACDIPSHLYSLSFAAKHDWSRLYPTQPELRAYLHECVARNGLAGRIRLGTRLLGAEYDEASGLWRLQTAAAPTTRTDAAAEPTSFTARFLVSAIGGLSRPAMPALPGMDSFAGPAFHSARWDHTVDLRGKRVAVIGTGASAVQFVPEIAPQVAQLDIYQRTAPWVLPKIDRAIGPLERRALRSLPGYRPLFRWWLYWKQEALAFGFTVDVRLLARARTLGLKLLRRQVASDALRAKLTPDYTAGCKRILISNDYYPALARPNVALVTEPIRAITPRGVITDDGIEHPADAIVYGTGFQATDPLGSLRIVGR
ncbi:MAG TPA: NAD(P)/FAD-dependent oxidoreductase, partial [Burkholderiaceae bacterium]|nr:NAD(P)/FAD-dependent oxidoreductase [Burkholderiaceae bacterium]